MSDNPICNISSNRFFSLCVTNKYHKSAVSYRPIVNLIILFHIDKQGLLHVRLIFPFLFSLNIFKENKNRVLARRITYINF